MQQTSRLTVDEAALLLACARVRPDAGAVQRFLNPPGPPLRWGAMLDAAAAHGVLPLLHAALARADIATVPRPVLERLRVEARANVHNALFLTAELLRLLKAFEQAGIMSVPFKGPVLAAMAYGDVTLRQFTDLDIFVRKADLPGLARLMMAQGYLSRTHDGEARTVQTIAMDGDVGFRGPSCHAFYRPDGRCRVDLQWRMADRHFAFTLDGAAAAWDYAAQPVAGRSVRTFSATDTLLVLCVHGAKHEFENLKWVCDVAECVASQRETIDWRALLRKARALNATRMVCFGLALAEQLLGTALPPEIARRVRADRALPALVAERRATLFGSDSGRVETPRLVFYLRTKDGWRERARFCATYARQFVATLVTPNARDAAWVTLPPPLRGLYYVVRPVRLLADGARSVSLRRRRPAAARAAIYSRPSREASTPPSIKGARP